MRSRAPQLPSKAIEQRRQAISGPIDTSPYVTLEVPIVSANTTYVVAKPVENAFSPLLTLKKPFAPERTNRIDRDAAIDTFRSYHYAERSRQSRAHFRQRSLCR